MINTSFLFFRYNDKVGYAPAQYLKRYDDPNLDILYDALPGPVTRNRDGSSAGTKLTPRRYDMVNKQYNTISYQLFWSMIQLISRNQRAVSPEAQPSVIQPSDCEI